MPVDAHEEQALQLTGIHHLTAISAKPRDNLAFYTGLLGMRLVKKAVNQDDVSAARPVVHPREKIETGCALLMEG